MNENAITVAIRARVIARRERERKQLAMFREDDDFAETIRGKLDGRLHTNQFWNFSRCGKENIYRTCEGCRAVETFKYRCSLKWCPRCQWWLTERRKKILLLWATRVKQPKHLVLTQKNFKILTPSKLKAHTHALARMRRRKIFRNVKGGCVTVEITNEDNGWHVHSHWLIDVRWLDMQKVSQTWGKLVGQEFAIVKIKDVRGTDYLKEVSKYVCEGSEMAKWAPEHILEFVTAVRGRRFFFPFGDLFHKGAAIRAELRGLRPERLACECGCSDFIFEDETQAIIHEAALLTKRRRR